MALIKVFVLITNLQKVEYWVLLKCEIREKAKWQNRNHKQYQSQQAAMIVILSSLISLQNMFTFFKVSSLLNTVPLQYIMVSIMDIMDYGVTILVKISR